MPGFSGFSGWNRAPAQASAPEAAAPAAQTPFTEGRGNAELLELFGLARPPEVCPAPQDASHGWGFDWTLGEETREDFERDPMVELGMGHLDDGRTGVRAKLGVTERRRMFGPLWNEVGTAGCNVESTSGPDGTSVGAGCQVGSGGLILDESHADKRHDAYRRSSVSEGPSLGFRTHTSDEDGDGEREYGFGFDVGPVGYDYRTESAWRMLTDHNPTTWWVGPLVNELL